MKTDVIAEYVHADFLVFGNPSTEIGDIFNDNNPDLLFERFEDKLIWHLLKSAGIDLSVDGRSNQVIDELLWEEYHNGTAADQERITKQVKTALHNLYKARFIKKDRNGNVFLASDIHIHRIYGHLPEYVQVVVTSHYYEDSEPQIYEHHILAIGEKTSTYDDMMSFVSARQLGPISRAMVVAKRMDDACTPADFQDEFVYDILKKAGWITEYNGKVSIIGDFKITEVEDEDKYYLEYYLDETSVNNRDY